MAYTTGRFVWRELLSTDPAAARAFYGELFGWQTKEVPMGDFNYTLFSANGRDVAGGMKVPMAEVPPHWYSYVSVESVDATVERAKAAGANIIVPARDIPNVGRFAVMLDDQGAVTAPFRAATGDAAPAMPKPGDFCWESLSTTDKAKSVAFYTKVYGWKEGSGGGTSTFGTGDGMENQVASIAEVPAGTPSHWLTYVAVDKLAAANERAKKLGGSILMDAIPVPGIGTFSIIQDPQKATIAMFQGE
jgi:predicted enzyme related to lactoylglutathione lyase